MVSLKVVRTTNTTYFHQSSAPAFTAVVVGGTSGIGAHTVRGFATSFGKDGPALRVYIVGRNREAADKLIAECKEACPAGHFEFVQASDLTLLKNVDATCKALTEALVRDGGENHIDYLALSQGFLSLGSRQETVEGLEKMFSITFYSRMRFATNLLPQLDAAPHGSHIVTVLNPTMEGRVVVDDLSLRKNFSLSNSMAHQGILILFFLEGLASRHPNISCIHYYPSLVMTDLMSKSPLPKWIAGTWKYALAPVAKFVSVPGEEVGQRMLFLATSGRFPARNVEGVTEAKDKKESIIATGSDGTKGSGTYRVNWNNEIMAPKKSTDAQRAEGVVEKVWEHTMTAFTEIEAGRVFSG